MQHEGSLAANEKGHRRLDNVVSVRFSDDELARLREAAGDRGVSQLIREAVLQSIVGTVAASSLPRATTMSWGGSAGSDPRGLDGGQILQWLSQPGSWRVGRAGT
jgi:hypothetical protein